MRRLSVRLIAKIGALCSLFDKAAVIIDSTLYVVRDRRCDEIVLILNYLVDMGIFAIRLLQDKNDEVITGLVKNVAFLVSDILQGITDIFSMRDKRYKVCEQSIPPTIHHELRLVPGRDVGRLVLSQIGRIYLFWSEKNINQITAQHRALVAAINVAQEFQLAMGACSSLTTFDDA